MYIEERMKGGKEIKVIIGRKWMSGEDMKEMVSLERLFIPMH
jgi:hypothetical protein